jgi:hypothetical protein
MLRSFLFNVFPEPQIFTLQLSLSTRSTKRRRKVTIYAALSSRSNVEPLEKVRPTAAYMLTIDDIKEFPKYEKLWKEIFQLR